MTTDIQHLVEAMADDIRTLMHTLMESNPAGNRLSIKELRDSSLKNDIIVKASQAGGTGEVMIEVFYNSVLEWDRKPRQGKHPSVADIRQWAQSKGLPTDNSTLNLIRRAIWWNGHAGQPILDMLDKQVETLFEKQWADRLSEAITAEVESWFA